MCCQAMEMRSKATFNVALALLGCLVGSLVNAQVFGGEWGTKQKQPLIPQVPAPSYPVKNILHPQIPQYPQPGTKYVPPSKIPHYPQPQPGTKYVPSSQISQYPQPQPGTKYVTPPPSPQIPIPLKQIPVSPQTCQVTQYQRIPCGPQGITGDACSAISCCFDGQQCYYGKSVTVQCTKDGQFIVVVARDATLPFIDLMSTLLLGQGQSCTFVDSNSAFAIYQFHVTACGSIVMEEPGVIIYENRMTSTFEVAFGPYGSITRDTQYQVLFQCRYIGVDVETLVVEVDPNQNPPIPVAALGPIRVELRLANGKCTVKGCNEADVAYNSYYANSDYPVTKVLRDPVYAEVRILVKTDPSLVLTLGRCWTTTSALPSSLPQWDILVHGCPYKDDRYQSVMVPVATGAVDFPNHYKRFIFWMFTFVDQTLHPLQQQLYLHCSTTVCVPSTATSCVQACTNRKKRDVASQEPLTVVSSGPLIMTI